MDGVEKLESPQGRRAAVLGNEWGPVCGASPPGLIAPIVRCWQPGGLAPQACYPGCTTTAARRPY